MTYREYMRDAGRAYLRSVLDEAGGNITQAARLAGISRATFYRRLAAYKIPLPQRQVVGNEAWRSLEA